MNGLSVDVRVTQNAGAFAVSMEIWEETQKGLFIARHKIAIDKKLLLLGIQCVCVLNSH